MNWPRNDSNIGSEWTESMMIQGLQLPLVLTLIPITLNKNLFVFLRYSWVQCCCKPNVKLKLLCCKYDIDCHLFASMYIQYMFRKHYSLPTHCTHQELRNTSQNN